jgi:hypothetical protein
MPTRFGCGQTIFFPAQGNPDFVRALGGDLVEAYRQAPLAISPEDLPNLGFRWPKYILSWPRIFYDLITHSSRRRGCAWLARFKKQTDELDRLDLGAISTPELTRLCVQYIREVFKDVDVLYLLAQGAALAGVSESLPRLAGRTRPDAPVVRRVGRHAGRGSRPGSLATGSAGPRRWRHGGRGVFRKQLGRRSAPGFAAPNPAGNSWPPGMPS